VRDMERAVADGRISPAVAAEEIGKITEGKPT
jgi:hypothetical protein